MSLRSWLSVVLERRLENSLNSPCQLRRSRINRHVRAHNLGGSPRAFRRSARLRRPDQLLVEPARGG